MEPVHIFYKDLPVDENNIFIVNLTEKNQVEEVKFKKSREYAVTGLSVNQDIGTDFIAVGETDREEVLSKLIQTLVKGKREPYLFSIIFNEEAMGKLILFERRSSKEVPFIEYTFYNATTKKNETVDFYNYQLHLEKSGFEQADAELEFLYTVKMSRDKKKLIRKMTMGKKQENYFFQMNQGSGTYQYQQLIEKN